MFVLLFLCGEFTAFSAIFGFFYLAYDERRKLLAGPSEGAQHPAVDGQHHTGDEGRGRAQQESSGAAEL